MAMGKGMWAELWVRALFVVVVTGVAVPVAFSADASIQAFDENFSILFAHDHFTTSENGQIWHLKLDKKSGSGFQTKNRYRFGWFSMKLKLVAGDSAGVVTAYYMASKYYNTRDELDFEFLGNKSGQPYALQTNIYCNGTGNREMRHELWFDPTADFHTYSFLWNTHQIVFFVDLVPIRVYRNTEAIQGRFPNSQPMSIVSSIWNADQWATRGGLDKTDWKNAPFVSSYKKFKADGCLWKDPYPPCVSTTANNWWDQPSAWTLSESQKLDYLWVRRNFLIYDYCRDTQRFAEQGMPSECSDSPWPLFRLQGGDGLGYI